MKPWTPETQAAVKEALERMTMPVVSYQERMKGNTGSTAFVIALTCVEIEAAKALELIRQEEERHG